MRIIDAHTHVLPHYADLAVQAMDRCAVDCVVTLEWHDGYGKRLREHLTTFAAYPGRFVVFGTVEWARINEPGFGEMAARQMAEDVGRATWRPRSPFSSRT